MNKFKTLFFDLWVNLGILNMHSQWLQFLPFSWLGFSFLVDMEATAFHYWHVTSVKVMMNCCMLAQSVSDCLQAACSGFLSSSKVQTICDVNTACSTVSARAFFTQIRKWNKGLVAHLLPSSTQIWNILYFMSSLWHHWYIVATLIIFSPLIGGETNIFKKEYRIFGQCCNEC
jgi:hypothetical protein